MGPGHSITKIRGTKSDNVKPLLDYIQNPEKTILKIEFEDEEPIEGAKTIQLVSGINCNVKTAKLEFDLAREKYLDEKTERLRPGERANVAFHLIQSFEGTNYDPKFIHELGVELAKDLLGDNFQALVATHINTENYHNHIVFNAYSIKGPYKYHDKKQTVALIKELNDKLSQKYGLEIIVDPDMQREHSYKEYMEIKNGTSWKEQIRQDIKATMEISTNFEEFKDYMKSIGYELQENERSITYKAADSIYKVRDIKLGREFTKDELEKYWEKSQEKEIKEKLERMTSIKDKKESLYVSKYDYDGRKRSVLERIFLKAIKILKKLGEYITDEEEQEKNYNKVQGLIDAMQKANELGVSSREDLLEKIAETGKEISTLKSENAAYGNLLDNLNEIYDNIGSYDGLKDKVIDLKLNPKDLEVKEFSKSEIRANKAKLNPMTNDQKRILFELIDKEQYYKLDCKFDEISRFEANDVIDFLNKKTSEKPSILITQEEFELKRLEKKYEIAKEKRLEALKAKFSNPLSENEKKELLSLVGNQDIDILNATKYDYIRVKNYVNRSNPLINRQPGTEPIDPRLKEQLFDLLKIYPKENIDNIRDNLDSLDNQTAKKLYNYLLEEGLTPEILVEDKEERYERLVGDLELENQEICNQYRYIAEMLDSYGIEDVASFKEEIYQTKDELEKKKETYEKLSEVYGDLSYIKRNLELTSNERFIYGEDITKKDNLEVVEIDKPREEDRKEEETYKVKKQKGIHL